MQSSKLRKSHSQKGFSLVETLLVVVVIGSLVFLMVNIPNAMMLINKSKHLSLAREIAAKQIEDKRNIKYENLINDNSPINDNRLNLIPQSSGTVEVADCPPTVCLSSEHLKQIIVTVNWTDNSKAQTVTLQTMIGEGGINQ